MRETQAIIERVRRVSDTLHHIELSVDPGLLQLSPGQSLFAAPLDAPGWDPYLREQWIPVGTDAGTLIIERPATRSYAPGTVISLLSPVGRPIPLRPNLRHLLLIAEDLLPTPLVMLARQVLAQRAAVTLVLGGGALRYPLELLPKEVEVLHGETDWTWPDQVDTIGWADQVIALAPTYAQEDVYADLYDTVRQMKHHDIPDEYVFGLYYFRLACATGACHACQIAGSKASLLACTDGPAIDLKQVMFR